ncbi:DNA topoisomerase I [Candidatus Collierbacteria bacterium RIFOXYD1_FULL_40_9]|uniref:DNA topoisomerase 1 n=1 Tax=Candidatus Collierbacteria bacterium RIFOXYD1_FULL_40_9 TaxID=1817731 RepID=A0A1F5FUX8_9BACT|nr:MAG: DNA topoisomerase I [Candidatus Collierbacteria bacterium RIFOXYD1_FULL_40_9]
MKLVIVESPTKTKSLSKYLGNEYEIMASMGHIRDLPKSKMGIEIKEIEKSKNQETKSFEFVPTYETMDKKDDQVRRLRSVAAKADEIILASDPDREGEAIAWHVKEMLLENSKAPKTKNSKTQNEVKFKRIAFHSITKEAILEALDNPREIDMGLVNSQQARRFLDRLVGYKLSPILWKKVRRGLSAGRVQSVAVRLIVEKEREIEKHVSKEYWQIRVQVKAKKDLFWVELAKIENKKQEVNGEAVAKKVLADLENGNYKVLDIKKSTRKVQPNAPFKTSTLQQAAANVLGWSAKRTMNVAQRLYEQGDITYHRTDSFNLAPVAIEAVRDFIKKEYGDNYLPATPRVYKTGGKVVAQEAHEAVRPTNIAVSPEKFVGQESGGDQEKLYSLIWRRTVACQMIEAIFDDTRVEVISGQYLLTANGVMVRFDGWRKLFPQKSKTKVVEGEEPEEQTLPELEKDQELQRQKVTGDQKFTQPPARFNDASLIKELEKRGIGRPSTYAAIISTIIDRRYVEQKEKRFYPTSIGKAVVDFLVEHFGKEMEYEFTAKMETELDEIAAGKLDWEKMLGKFWGIFAEQIAKVDKDAVRVGVPTESTGETCPECKEGEIVIRDGKFGKFLSCSRYPDCKYKAPYIQYVPDVACEKCGKRVVMKKTSKGRDFYGCEDYPNCTWAAWKLLKIRSQISDDSSKES